MSSSPEPRDKAGLLKTSPAATLCLFASVCAALVTIVHLLTRAPIAAARSAYSLEQVHAVLVNGNPAEDTVTPANSPALHEVIDPDLNGRNLIDTSKAIYAMSDGRVAIPGFSSDGYSGRIEVVTGINLTELDGEAKVIAVRVVAHRETPGIGDRIIGESWLDQFQAMPHEIDALSGATISAAAVTDAVGRTIEFANLNVEKLKALTVQPETAR